MISNERARLLYGSLLSTLFQLGLDRFVRIETRTNDSYEDKLSYLIEEIRASLLDLPIIKQRQKGYWAAKYTSYLTKKSRVMNMRSNMPKEFTRNSTQESWNYRKG